MKIRAIGIIVLLSCTVFMLGIDACDRSEKEPERNKTVESNSRPPNQTIASSARAETTGDGVTRDNAPEAKEPQRLSPQEYGRENPFDPIVKKGPARRSKPTKTAANKTKQITVHLTAILGGTAILKVDGTDKSVSVGDTVSGMKVSEIRSGEVLLDKGGKKYTIALGSLSKL